MSKSESPWYEEQLCKDLNECLFQTVTSLRKSGVRHGSFMSTHMLLTLDCISKS